MWSCEPKGLAKTSRKEKLTDGHSKENRMDLGLTTDTNHSRSITEKDKQQTEHLGGWDCSGRMNMTEETGGQHMCKHNNNRDVLQEIIHLASIAPLHTPAMLHSAGEKQLLLMLK